MRDPFSPMCRAPTLESRLRTEVPRPPTQVRPARTRALLVSTPAPLLLAMTGRETERSNSMPDRLPTAARSTRPDPRRGRIGSPRLGRRPAQPVARVLCPPACHRGFRGQPRHRPAPVRGWMGRETSPLPSTSALSRSEGRSSAARTSRPTAAPGSSSRAMRGSSASGRKVSTGESILGRVPPLIRRSGSAQSAPTAAIRAWFARTTRPASTATASCRILAAAMSSRTSAWTTAI